MHPYKELRVEGLEPPHISAPEPKSGVSTNFTILACGPSNVRESSLESSGFVGKLLVLGCLSKCAGVVANPQFDDFFQTFEMIHHSIHFFRSARSLTGSLQEKFSQT